MTDKVVKLGDYKNKNRKKTEGLNLPSRQEGFEERMARIRTSLERINTLMNSLKEVSKNDSDKTGRIEEKAKE